MGFIGKGGKTKAPSIGTTIVAAGSKIRGELTLEATLHIDGNIEGTLDSTSDVSVGESGSFEGTLRARHVLVSGYVNGKIDCERLEIVSNGKVFGEVSSNEFVIESGGQFVGESQVKDQRPVAALDHRTDPEAAEVAQDEADLQQA